VQTVFADHALHDRNRWLCDDSIRCTDHNGKTPAFVVQVEHEPLRIVIPIDVEAVVVENASSSDTQQLARQAAPVRAVYLDSLAIGTSSACEAKKVPARPAARVGARSGLRSIRAHL